ncbi:hypothetical protein LTR95_013818 [Oleoguttula sp. CCFEE 5521]
MWQTRDGLTEALELCQNAPFPGIWLEEYVGTYIPSLLLQLDLDEKCYAYIQSHSDGVIVSEDECVMGPTLERPASAMANAQKEQVLSLSERTRLRVLEDPPLNLTERIPLLNLAAPELLLKLKLLVDLVNVRRVRTVLTGRLLPEIDLYVEREVIRSPLSLTFCGRDNATLQEVQDTLLWHVDFLRSRVTRLNRYFFDILLGMRYDYDFMKTSDMSDVGEAERYLDFAGPAWEQTEGVVHLLQAAHSAAMRDRVRETEHSGARMWDFLESVVVDAQSITTRTRVETPLTLDYEPRWKGGSGIYGVYATGGIANGDDAADSDDADGAEDEEADGDDILGDDAEGNANAEDADEERANSYGAAGDAGETAAQEVAFADCTGAECGGCWECG